MIKGNSESCSLFYIFKTLYVQKTAFSIHMANVMHKKHENVYMFINYHHIDQSFSQSFIAIYGLNLIQCMPNS